MPFISLLGFLSASGGLRDFDGYVRRTQKCFFLPSSNHSTCKLRIYKVKPVAAVKGICKLKFFSVKQNPFRKWRCFATNPDLRSKGQMLMVSTTWISFSVLMQLCIDPGAFPIFLWLQTCSQTVWICWNAPTMPASYLLRSSYARMIKKELSILCSQCL